jgi:formamidopyrimidine-DNA glycosylase
MPELPEVETTRRGLERAIVGRTIASLEIRERRLRWPVGKKIAAELEGRRIDAIERRGKYLLVNVEHGALLVHLGMSGSLRYLQSPDAPSRHDHVDLCFVGGGCVRFNDPRRFGSLHFATDPPRHPLLRNLGPEPLGPAFTADYLRATCRGRRVAIKLHLMNSKIVVGVGNIYANEALFRARIHPARPAGRISRERLALLVDRVRDVLGLAVERGGTTLRDYVSTEGKPGYFKLELDVYDREGMPCKSCGAPIRRAVLGQRAAFFCARCQR